VDFMLDTIRNEGGAARRPLFLDIIYRAESLEGDRIESRIVPADANEMKELDKNFTELLPSGPLHAYWHNLVKMEKKSYLSLKKAKKNWLEAFHYG
jgi:hypothetical protein